MVRVVRVAAYLPEVSVHGRLASGGVLLRDERQLFAHIFANDLT